MVGRKNEWGQKMRIVSISMLAFALLGQVAFADDLNLGRSLDSTSLANQRGGSSSGNTAIAISSQTAVVGGVIAIGSVVGVIQSSNTSAVVIQSQSSHSHSH
jgi:hypothetical protein